MRWFIISFLPNSGERMLSMENLSERELSTTRAAALLKAMVCGLRLCSFSSGLAPVMGGLVIRSECGSNRWCWWRLWRLCSW